VAVAIVNGLAWTLADVPDEIDNSPGSEDAR